MRLAGKRTRSLTAAPGAEVAGRAVQQLGQQLAERASSAPPGEPGDGSSGAPPVEVSLPLLRRWSACPEALALPGEPFTWKPLFVRRSLGLAIVEGCATQRFRAPAEAAGPLAAAAVAHWERTGRRVFHWEPWYAALPAGARAAVLAEAVTWATALWSAFGWWDLAARVRFGGPDGRWRGPGTFPLRLRARAELEVVLGDGARDGPGGAGSGGSRRVGRSPGPRALVTVAGGCPGPAWAEELGYLALVVALADPSRPVPVRVMGLWPDAGMTRSVEVDEAHLAGAAAELVGDVVTAVRRAR